MPVTINGDGLIEVGGTSTTQGRVRLAEDTDNGSNYVELTAPASVTANRTVTFPDANIDFTTGLAAAQGGTGLTSPGANGNILTSNGTTWTSAAPASSYVGARATVYTSGTNTFTIPAGITALKVTVIGGGGGGGGALANSCASSTGGGGGGGGFAIRWITGQTPGATVTVTVGAGGAGSTSGTATAGGTSSFGALVSATGGGGGGSGNTGIAGAAGANGAGSSGTINLDGYRLQQNGLTAQGQTSGQAFVFGLFALATNNSNGFPGRGYGSGGSGAQDTQGFNTQRTGGTGSAGIVIIEY